ncbi:HNH endonuclease [Neobacillus niacini]|uniref:HNH endonuclease n=1 Tax=Neobacillus niacini TaxID=86668 RepID=UPI00069073D4|nr:HNH endonuclease [Neobacillus niacini]MEC1525654.1 HNH endonuclease [Neobacillus niacini]
MAFLKDTGKVLGEIAGYVTGEPLKYLGKKINSEYIQEIGKEIKKATENTGSMLGNVAEGTWETSSGIINTDNEKRDAGLNELKKSAATMAKGVGGSLKNTYSNGKDVVTGITTNNRDQLLQGAKGLGKTAAVATLTFGVLDALDIMDFDGVDDKVEASMFDQDDNLLLKLDNTDYGNSHEPLIQLDTRNEALDGGSHSVTGIEFELQSVTLPSGQQVEGVFPEFDSEYTISLPESMYLDSDNTQFSYANQSLDESINQNPNLEHQFTDDQLKQIDSNTTPDGYVWHHDAEPGKLELVDEKIHAETGHTGGREIWGGGSEYRK